MAEFKVIHDEAREESSRGRKAFTFLVDGVPSMMWFPNALDEEGHPGRPADYFVQRCIRRLQEGRSAEALGDAASPAVLPGAVNGGHVPRGAPRQARGKVLLAAPQRDEGEAATDIRGKPRSGRQRFTYELDGKKSDKQFNTESEAKAAMAIAAFMTRGKLGRVAEAQKALEEQFSDAESVEVYVCERKHKICAVVDGDEYSVGFEPDGTFRFKKLEANPELEEDNE